MGNLGVGVMLKMLGGNEDSAKAAAAAIGKQQFLDMKTSKGVFTLTTHNKHNGYYGGFSVRCREMA